MNMNKQFLKVSLVALTTAMYSTTASTVSAALSDDGDAEATIITPASVVQSTPMNFGAFSPDVGGDTVALTAVATTARSITTGTLHGGTVNSGAFTIGGLAGQVVDIAVADGATDLQVGGVGTALTFTPVDPVGGLTHTIDALPANNVIYVGGSIAIPASAAAGTYTSATAYTVTVSYQ